MISNTLHIRWLNQQAYEACWQAMKKFTLERNDDTMDEVWLVEHPPVFTQGQNGKAEHVLHPGDIPIVKTDRGGQITYHGPGQLMFYTLVDLQRRKMNIREFVCCLEKAVIALVAARGGKAYGKRDAPGVYVLNKEQVEQKICSIGLRVKRGATYHGLALNIAMDLEPFQRINPCGFKGLQVTQLQDISPLAADPDLLKQIGIELTKYFSQQLGYTTQQFS